MRVLRLACKLDCRPQIINRMLVVSHAKFCRRTTAITQSPPEKYDLISRPTGDLGAYTLSWPG
jgi:hypothetical protein